MAYLSLPKMTTPTLSVSKLRAIPRIPDRNSTISPACTLFNPTTLAIPSPMLMTVPNSFTSFSNNKLQYHLCDVHDFVLDHFCSVCDTQFLGSKRSLQLYDISQHHLNLYIYYFQQSFSVTYILHLSYL